MRDPRARFSRYLQRWWDIQQHGGAYPGQWLHGRDAEALAHEFRRDAQFEVAQAAYLHRRPDADGARLVVESLVPLPTESDAELLIDAIVRAGSTARKLRATTALGATVTVFALVFRNILRGR